MAADKTKLAWEWRAKRALSQRAGVRIETVAREGGWFSGILNAPSMAGSLPDPMEVTATVLAIDRSGTAIEGGTIRFRIPKMELKGVEAGSLVAIGLIGDAVVCLTPAPGDVSVETLGAWLPDAPCD